MSDAAAADGTRETLEAFGAGQLAALAKEWGGVLGADVHGGQPALLKASDALPSGDDVWPALVTLVEMESPEGAQLVVVAPFVEAAVFFETPLPDAADGATEQAEEALREAFALVGPATDRAMRKGVAARFRVKSCASRRVRLQEEMREAAGEGDRFILRLAVTAKGGRLLHLWVLVPKALASQMNEARDRSGKGVLKPPSTVVAALAPGGCILIVDDQVLIRRVLRWILEKQGYQVVEASNGTEALHMLPAHKPALVLLDVMMPQMDGVELCKRIRAYPQYRSLPVVFCTAKDTRQDVMEAIKAGAQDYVIKPFKKELLLAKVAKAIAGRSSEGGEPRPSDALSPPTDGF